MVGVSVQLCFRTLIICCEHMDKQVWKVEMNIIKKILIYTTLCEN